MAIAASKCMRLCFEQLHTYISWKQLLKQILIFILTHARYLSLSPLVDGRTLGRDVCASDPTHHCKYESCQFVWPWTYSFIICFCTPRAKKKGFYTH